MDTYLVGGAVRDALLGLPIQDRDWVVVGATSQVMLDAGFTQVGKDFPVFLHPDTHEEYALARKERKTGPGHGGFEAATENVTLEADLERRDLTINAIAMTPDGGYVDPFGGRDDLSSRVLRHVSAAFEEDPLRVLRVARFAARLAPLGFRVAAETADLCRRMARRGDLQELPAERVWDELYSAMASDAPLVFFAMLQEVDALPRIAPQLDSRHLARFGERAAALRSQDERVVYLFSQLGPEGAADALDALRAPSALRDLAVLVARHYRAWANVLQLDGGETEALLAETDAYRRTERFHQLCAHCATHDEGGAERQALWLSRLEAALSVDTREIARHHSGPAIGAAIRAARIDKLST
ncbi:MAG: multifunctional CCA tRNA nucleotidyl transferase/2'3'-cyclic phosphodiesterase/2'nucleotidase/phosphatase [Gammaproteobacteria bacterium]|nr:multifunctional CCA tRNA nucleotidyl transferase/2'3'-cyclic phosphodiesterase/2'nucleotidase/phosphatase [Gammaproteobacteria bacterium]